MGGGFVVTTRLSAATAACLAKSLLKRAFSDRTWKKTKRNATTVTPANNERISRTFVRISKTIQLSPSKSTIRLPGSKD
jgi:hypothetical protein